MSVYSEFEAANAEYVRNFADGDAPIPPARKVAIVTCMDARLHVDRFLGLKIGDAHIIRNAGGRVTDDTIRSLVISQRLLGTNEVVVIHHTDCGMVTFSNEDLAAKIKAELGVDASGYEFYPFSDLEQSVRDDVKAVRNSPLVPKDIPVTGAVYDVHSGKLTRVE